ncbi:NAD(P)H-hydrate epimerase [Ectothiorhodospira magna]|uniref:Bifunctional NAD(P)H-hydrate repair enzyme n=1 Tax=Ectothiorhodospira magna TaxID=867345 RepID=A0A1H9G2V2_9GAMM|nr:NAD(P)H-hydrate dehydratase [Ectothiorhodospira magna]SEQ44401.1 NAD(P)H-hydrate epimerase [Ectothiorhodospira magna]
MPIPLPEALYTAAQVRELDRRAIEDQGIPGYTLMGRAGAAALERLQRQWPQAGTLAIYCGPGNNGGDGYVLARLAHEAGLSVQVVAATDPARLRGEAALAWQDWHALGQPLSTPETALDGADVIVDALLGTGLTRAVEGDLARLIHRINQTPTPVLALDIPSGLNGDTGAVMGAVIEADVTLSFIGLKLGLMTGAGPACRGALFLDELEVPASVFDALPPAARRFWPHGSRAFPPRPRDAHKGHCGHVLVIGGGQGMPGAARLAAEAAARTGAGLVSLATHPDHAAFIPLARPELMCHGIHCPDDLKGLLARADVVAMGPGLGTGDWGQRLWAYLGDWHGPIVVDADALNLLAAAPQYREDWILTPHPGEAGRLLGCDTPTIQVDRPGAAAAITRRYGGVCVLKGAGSLIQDAAGLWLCDTGNPGMASGGMGDVLTGIIAGLLAQGLPVDDTLAASAALGCWVHGAAADRAARSGERGLLASDVLCHLPEVINS